MAHREAADFGSTSCACPCRGENGFLDLTLGGIAPISGPMSAYQELKRRINRTVTFEPCLPRPGESAAERFGLAA